MYTVELLHGTGWTEVARFDPCVTPLNPVLITSQKILITKSPLPSALPSLTSLPVKLSGKEL